MKIRDLLILAGCLGAASHASALSLGASQGAVILGSPLDLTFHVRPDAGLTAEHSCITAAIRMGDSLVSEQAVNVLFNGSDRVRIRGRSPVNEPVVTIDLAAGCDNTVRRSYTFFSDPPQELIHSTVPLQLPAAPPVVSIPVDSPAVRQVAPRLASSFGAHSGEGAPASTSAAAPRPRTAPAATAAKPAPRPTPKPAPKPAAKQAIQPVAPPPAPEPAPAPQPPQPAAAAVPETPAPAASVTPEPTTEQPSAPSPQAQAPAPAPTESKPTLRMEALDSLGESGGLGDPNASHAADASAAAPGISAPAQASDTPSAQGSSSNDTGLPSADSPAAANPRMSQLESQLQQLIQEQRTNRQQMLDLQTQLIQAQDQSQALPNWVLAMMGLLGLSAGTILWLLHRVRTERANSARWAQAVETASQRPSDMAATPLPALQSALPADSTAHDAREAVAPNMATGQAAAMLADVPAPPATAPAPLAAASYELPLESAQDFRDVQEQADFFASLGQHAQAIELLRNHLLQNSRTSANGYLALLTLLARLGDNEAFSSSRAQFEAHFNVVVPEFTAFSRKGRSLQEGYPEVLASVEAMWEDEQALPLLRSLLSRQSNDSAAQRRFELQAFDELLMLHDVAASTPAEQRGAMPSLQAAPSTAVEAEPMALPVKAPTQAPLPPPAPAPTESTVPSFVATSAAAPVPLADVLLSTPELPPAPAAPMAVPLQSHFDIQAPPKPLDIPAPALFDAPLEMPSDFFNTSLTASTSGQGAQAHLELSDASAPEAPALSPAQHFEISLEALNASLPEATAPAAASAANHHLGNALSLDFPSLEGMELALPGSAFTPTAAARATGRDSPFSGPQLSVGDGALLQELQLDFSHSDAPIASAPAAGMSLSLPALDAAQPSAAPANDLALPAASPHTKGPLLDLNDFLTSSSDDGQAPRS